VLKYSKIVDSWIYHLQIYDLKNEMKIENKPIPIDSYMSKATLNSIINFHDELYE
jgi:hypothetical protein